LKEKELGVYTPGVKVLAVYVAGVYPAGEKLDGVNCAS
jgi:hypothetical protein